MRTETRTVRIGEWLGDVPADWDWDKFFREDLSYNKEIHDKAVELFKKMQEALKLGETVYATTRGGYKHKVWSCGLYDGWVFWKPRPCFAHEGAIPGEHIEEYYNLRDIEITESHETP